MKNKARRYYTVALKSCTPRAYVSFKIPKFCWFEWPADIMEARLFERKRDALSFLRDIRSSVQYQRIVPEFIGVKVDFQFDDFGHIVITPICEFDFPNTTKEDN